MWIRILRAETLTGGLYLGKSGCVLRSVCHFFLSRTQKSITLASTEAEYVAMATGIKETYFCGISGVLYFRTATLGAL